MNFDSRRLIGGLVYLGVTVVFWAFVFFLIWLLYYSGFGLVGVNIFGGWF